VNSQGDGRVQLKCDGTRWRTGEEVKGQLANGVGSQYSSHYLGTWFTQHYYKHTSLPVVDWNDAPTDLNGLVRFAERRNLVSALVPSHFKLSLLHTAACRLQRKPYRYLLRTPTFGAPFHYAHVTNSLHNHFYPTGGNMTRRSNAVTTSVAPSSLHSTVFVTS
jgi:hypothetical protein